MAGHRPDCWGLALYVVVLLVAFSAARALHAHAIGSLYVHETPREVYLSIGRLPPDTIAALAGVATASSEVRAALAAHSDLDARFTDYVMPTDLLISEVPRHLPGGRRTGHQWQRSQDQSLYKIVFTRAHLGRSEPAAGTGILGRGGVHQKVRPHPSGRRVSPPRAPPAGARRRAS